MKGASLMREVNFRRQTKKKLKLLTSRNHESKILLEVLFLYIPYVTYVDNKQNDILDHLK